MQAPIDIQHAEKLRIYDLKFNYQPADLDIVNDCNQYRILVKFPDNYWLKVGKKPYFLSEIHFREPGENAVMVSGRGCQSSWCISRRKEFSCY